MAIDGHLFRLLGKHLTVLRNLCAHHARIWNRCYALKPQMPKTLAGRKWLTDFSFPPDKIYPQLCCIAYLLNTIDGHSSFTNDIKRLLNKYPSVDAAAMGFPKKNGKKNRFGTITKPLTAIV